MSSIPVKRKLSAILAADAVGYSRMMGANEETTLKTLSAHRAVIDGIIEFHDGRIVGTAGDSVLAEFGSPVEAVRCAVEIQDALRTRNDSLPEDQRLQFRVGVNLGDVMVKGDDLLGDGVNVAARLESIAEPGGICISASVYDLIRGKLDLGFQDIGEQSLKNIEHPIRVYRVARDGSVPPGKVRRARRRHGRGALLGLGVAAVAAAAGYGYFVWLPEQREAAQAELARAAAEAAAARRQAAAAGASAEQAQRALEAERAAAEKAKADAEVARAHAETEAAKRKAEAELAAATQARDAAQREADAAEAAAERAGAEKAALEKAAADKAAAQKAAAEKAAAEKAAAAKLAAAQAAAAAAPARHYDGKWSAFVVCEPNQRFPERTFGLRASVANDRFSLRRGQAGEPGFLALQGTPDADGRLVLIGRGLTGKRSWHPGTAIEARFEGRIEGSRYEGPGAWGNRQCTAKLERAE
ncbi:MAG TPA: adenylate/guanylate cyclase domain-containing protein [Burkholderiales bacterium]|nr:adenylate/guanylate cyclase domain-containing protein [Burkholderiales bacterium]